MSHLLFIKKQQNFKLSSAGNYRVNEGQSEGWGLRGQGGDEENPCVCAMSFNQFALIYCRLNIQC